MAKKVRSVKNIFGETVHYDEHGKKIGESRTNFWGGTTHYDARGHKVAETTSNFWGGKTTRDTRGHKIGESNRNFRATSPIATKAAIRSAKRASPSGAARSPNGTMTTAE